jgi:hypothetical protein
MITRLFPAARLIVMLVLAGGGVAMTKQAAKAGALPPSVMHAIDLINDKTDDLLKAFG